MKKTIILVFLYVCTACFGQMLYAQRYPVFFGTYTSKSASKGLYVYDFDEKEQKFYAMDSIDESNPSFLAKRDHIIYIVNEDQEGYITSYDLKSKKVMKSLKTEGAHPCHVAVCPSAPLAVVSNYSGGSLSLFSLKDNGDLNQMEDFLKFEGSSVNKARQNESHIHSSFFSKDGSRLYVSDLGADLIYIFSIERSGDNYYFMKEGEIATKKGGGPRHLVFSENEQYLYSVLEMTGEIEVFAFELDKWVSKQEMSIYPKGFSAEHGAADIKISADGKYIYASNRGDANVLVSYEVKKNGLLKQRSIQSALGQGPRNINISPTGNYLLVTNQLSNRVQAFRLKKGKIIQTSLHIDVPKPVCVIF